MATLDRVKTKIQGLINTANTTTGNSDKDLTAAVNALVEKANSGTELPELATPATQDEVFLNQEYIDENGIKKTGTFTIDSELTQQESLIAQIQSAIDELPDAGSGGSSGGGGGVETCTVIVETDEPSSKLGVRIVDGLPVPIYQEENWESLTWEAPCGSIVAVAYPLTSYDYTCDKATYLGLDNGTYAVSGIMGYLQPIHLFRIDAQAGETAYIEMYEA